jgi:predicted phage terminase large subunit-like protein
MRLDMNSDFNWQTQANQNPRPAAGPVFNADWLGATWLEVPEGAYVFWVWDLAFEGEDDSDFVVGQAWAVTQAKAYLLRMIRGQYTFSETKALIREGLTAIPADIHIERKANGHAAINELEQEFPGVLAITPTDSKFKRAMSVQALVQSGAVEFPRCELPESVPHSMKYLKGELVAFPNAQHDDATDVFVHALRVWRERRVTAADAYAQAKRAGTDLEAVFGRLLG